jgi:hypothetical protein
MAKVKMLKGDAIPTTVYDVHGVYLKTQDGKWVRYEYKDVRGFIDPDGQYKGIFGGKKFLLLDGIKYPKMEWKEDLYVDFLCSQDIALYRKVHQRQLSNRDFTRALKHNWLLFEQIDDMTIEVKVNKQFIMNSLESQMQELYCYDELLERWYNRYILKDEGRKKIKLFVYDRELTVTIDKKDLMRFYHAARLVTDRLNAYTVAFKDRKPEHEIALMAMLDIALLTK